MAVPEHFVWTGGVAIAFGVGFTRTVAVTAEPGQAFAAGVIVNVIVTGDAVVLVKVPPILFPLPLAAMPVTDALLSLVHVKVVPVVLLLNVIAVIVLPEQMVCDTGVLITTGDGFTRTVAVNAAPGQPLADGVMVKVTVMGAAVVLVTVPLMFPLPLAAIPVTPVVLSLVHE